MTIQSVITKTNVPVKIWSPLEEVESQAIDQLSNMANLPFVFKHVAAMPDVHLGKGATVGSVVATKGAVCPCAVGVDIGCGMMAVKTDLTKDFVMDNLPSIRMRIERRVPVGHNSNAKATTEVLGWTGWGKVKDLKNMDRDLLERSRLQLGTLGGGNHFIEVCLDTENNVWVMLHSGSRNLGKVIAERHIETAKNLMKRLFIKLDDPDLAYFVQGTPEFEKYWDDLQIVQQYAYSNREEMMRRVLTEIRELKGGEFKILETVNCHHNYASREHHYGENVIVTRKGAVSAREGELGIIPGSMGTRSYIVRGRGNPESFHSCSHGAGRRMSRSQAKRMFNVDDLKKATAGVECRKDEGVIDEIPSAYKDIDQVMENQADLVETIAILKQVLCVKG